MAYPAYVREKARKLRVEKRLSIDEIAERLALPKTTIYYWVRDLPLGRERRANAGQRKGNQRMRAKYRLRRAAAYAQGRLEFSRLAGTPTFRDFVCLYMAEGYKRSRNSVAVCNSDPAIVVLCARWVHRFARNPVRYSVQYHADQDLVELQEFWARQLSVAPEEIPSAEVEQWPVEWEDVAIPLRRVERVGRRHGLPKPAAGVDGLPSGAVDRLGRLGA